MAAAKVAENMGINEAWPDIYNKGIYINSKNNKNINFIKEKTHSSRYSYFHTDFFSFYGFDEGLFKILTKKQIKEAKQCSTQKVFLKDR